MKRETLLEQGFSEEQVTLILNMFHNTAENDKKLQEQLGTLQTQLADYEITKAELDTLKREKMSESEKMEADKKEIEKNLAESRTIRNEAKVTAILAEIGITDSETIKDLVSDDENVSVAKARRYVDNFNKMREDTIKKTKEELQKTDVKPNGSNSTITDNENEVADLTMTKEKFNKMLMENYTEAKAWKDNNPDLYQQIMK